MGVEDVYQPGSVLDIPKRPPWHYGMSKREVCNLAWLAPNRNDKLGVCCVLCNVA